MQWLEHTVSQIFVSLRIQQTGHRDGRAPHVAVCVCVCQVHAAWAPGLLPGFAGFACKARTLFALCRS